MLWAMVRVALDNIRNFKLRSGLTMLAVVIGVAVIVDMAAIIEGLNSVVASQVSGLGSNIVTLTRLPQFAFRFPTEQERQRKELTLDDADTIRSEARNVSLVTAILIPDFARFPNPKVRYGNIHANNVRVLGVEPDYINVYTSFVHVGRFLTEADLRHRTRVVVLGSTVAQTMFPNLNPVGRTIYFESDPFEVIGVLEPRGSMFGFDRDNFIWLPITTMYKLHPESKDDLAIAMKADAQNAVPAVIDQVTEIMRRRRRVAVNAPNSFDVNTQNQFIELYRQLTSGIYLVLLVIASVSLLVGGIGVMTVMLIAVTERTREIGLRKAVGGRRVHILLQFLVEAMVLTAVGGLLGIVLAAGLAFGIDKLSPLPARLSPFWISLAFSVALAVGLFFGLYPAARASALDPIESLRYE